MKDFLEVCYEEYRTKGLGNFNIIRDDGNVSFEDPARWFDPNYQLTGIDVECLNMLKDGNVLDIACGTGVHLRHLQKMNRNVYGLDISEFSIELAKKFGAKNVSLISFWDFKPTCLFDNVICMNASIGFIGSIHLLDAFLKKCRSFLRTGGFLYIQGVDWRIDPKNKHKPYIERNIKDGVYPGTVKLHKQYGELEEKEFQWIWIDTDMLLEKASQVGFEFITLKFFDAKYFMILKK